jgi:hypothetical protein
MREHSLLLNTAVIVTCGVSLIVGCGPRANDRADSASPSGDTATDSKAARRLLDQAIEACGGSPAFEKLKMCKVIYRTRLLEMAHPTDYECVVTEDWFKYPDKIRRTVKTASGKEMLFTSDGRETWYRADDGKVMKFPAPRRGDAWPPIVETLLALRQLRQDDRSLKLVSVETIGGQESGCVVITSRGRPASRLYFDPLTHYVRRSVKDDFPDVRDAPESLRRPATIEVLFDDQKKVDGVVMATRSTAIQNGHKMLEVEVLAIEFLKTIDDRLFDKPKEKTEKGAKQK